MLENSLFNRKDMYIMSHDIKGKATFLKTVNKRRTMFRYDNLHLLDGIEFTSYSGIEIPILQPYNGSLNIDFYPYTDHNKLSGENQALHFFIYDDKFRYAVWNRLEETTFKLSKFYALLTPDFTIYVDKPSFYALQATFMTRFVGAYWQQCGYNVIPTASWGNADTFDFCFKGLPKNSPIAVGGLGLKSNPGALDLWHYGLLKLEETVSPSVIIIYGDDKLVLPELDTPVIFIKDNITKNFRN